MCNDLLNVLAVVGTIVIGVVIGWPIGMILGSALVWIHERIERWYYDRKWRDYDRRWTRHK